MFTTQWDSCLVLSHPVCKRPCTARYASPNESLPQGGHRVANPHRKHGAKRAGPLVIRSLKLVKPNWGWLETIILFMEEIRLTTCYLWNSYEKMGIFSISTSAGFLPSTVSNHSRGWFFCLPISWRTLPYPPLYEKIIARLYSRAQEKAS